MYWGDQTGNGSLLLVELQTTVLSGRAGGKRCRSQLQGQEAIDCGRPDATAQVQQHMCTAHVGQVGIGCVSSETYP